MSSPTFAASAALDGPDWFRQFRRAGTEAFAVAASPDTDQEIWRYSRIADLDLDGFGPAGPVVLPVPEGLDTGLTDPAGVAVVENGRVVRCGLSPELAAKGVRFGSAASMDHAEQYVGQVIGRSEDALAVANDAFGSDPLVLVVPRGVIVERPIVVVDWASAPVAAVFSRLVVRVEAGSSVSVVHLQRSDAERCWLAPVVELSAANDARLAYAVVQDLGRATWQTATVVAEAHQQSSLDVVAAAFGGQYARLRLDLRMLGRGASGNLAALYFADGEQMFDFRTLQDHQAPDCRSDLLFKGVVDDRSHSVYSGMIHVRPDARGTNAFQTNRNIKLSDKAWADSVPNLQIENNDVRCSHASTVGPIDEEQRFYLESRGVPTRRAEQLIVSGFFDDVAARLPADELRARIAAMVGAKLGEQR